MAFPSVVLKSIIILSNDQLIFLFDKYLDNACTEGELDQLFRLLEDPGQEARARAMIRKQLALNHEQKGLRGEALKDMLDQRLKQILYAIDDVAEERPGLSFERNRWLRYAAAVLVILSAAVMFIYFNREKGYKEKASTPVASIPEPIIAGDNKALLTLADGSTILLDSASEGLLALQGNTTITKLSNGQLSYAAGKEENATVLYNTMSTPRGSQYKIALPDGTGVWLNAASSITYPTAFPEDERKVSISGEVYFEVTHNSRKPFRVEVNDMSIEVLGTHFNVNAYKDEEAIKTTLLEGSVKVTHGKEKAVISPGKQATLTPSGSLSVNEANGDEVMAWKNGSFYFNRTTLPSLMRQLERWYDVEVVYSGSIPKLKFGGEIQRNLSLEDVLEILEKAEVHFKLEERKLTVLPF